LLVNIILIEVLLNILYFVSSFQNRHNKWMKISSLDEMKTKLGQDFEFMILLLSLSFDFIFALLVSMLEQVEALRISREFMLLLVLNKHIVLD